MQIRCDFEADPPELQYEWNHSTPNESLSDWLDDPTLRIKDATSSSLSAQSANQQRSVHLASTTKSLHEFVQNGTRSTLSYRLSEWSNFGQIVCSASNALGKSAEPCKINIKPHGPPCAPRDCRLENGPDRIQLTCQPCIGLISTVTTYSKQSSSMLGSGALGLGAVYNLRVYEQSPDSQNSLNAIGGSWTRFLPDPNVEQQDEQDANGDPLKAKETKTNGSNKSAKLVDSSNKNKKAKHSSQPIASAQADAGDRKLPAQLGNAQLIQNLTTNTRPEFVVNHLRPGSVYLLLLAAYNRRGSSQVKSFSISTLPLIQPAPTGKFGLVCIFGFFVDFLKIKVTKACCFQFLKSFNSFA